MNGIDGVTFYFGTHCHVEAGDNTKVRGLSGNEIKIGNNGDIRAFDNVTCLAGTDTVFNIGSYCDILIGHNSKGKVKDFSGIQVSGMGTFSTGDNCTITTHGNSILRVGSN